MRPELVDATLRRKQEERRRQEIMEIQHEMGVGVHIVEDLESVVGLLVTLDVFGLDGLDDADPTPGVHRLVADLELHAVRLRAARSGGTTGPAT